MPEEKDNYEAYAENVNMITGGGDTLQKAKASVLNSIDIIKSFAPEHIPSALKGEFQIIWKTGC